MPDDDSLLAQGTIDARNEGRMATSGRSTQHLHSNEVTVTLTRRQASALADIVANSARIIQFSLLQPNPGGEPTLTYLSSDEMQDLAKRLKR